MRTMDAMRTILMVAVLAMGGCAAVEREPTEGRIVSVYEQMPYCDELECRSISQHAYTLDGVDWLRIMCLPLYPDDLECSDIGCLTRDPGIECRFRH